MPRHNNKNQYSQQQRDRSPNCGLFKLFLICQVTIFAALVARQPTVEALWLFQDSSSAATATANQTLDAALLQQQQQAQQLEDSLLQQQVGTATASSGSPYSGFGSSLLSIAGIQPSSIAALLNTVGDTGFSYFNIQDQCRNRAACDLGHMLYRKLSFVHNWLIRTSVRTLTDMNNVYTQSWMEGMLGRNCTAVYMSCRQSPLEGLMNMAVLQHLAS